MVRILPVFIGPGLCISTGGGHAKTKSTIYIKQDEKQEDPQV